MIRAAARSLLASILLAAPARAAGPIPPAVTDIRPDGYRVHVPLGAAEIRTGDVEGEVLSEISLPGASTDAPAGFPQLPVRVLRLRIPWGVDARVRAEEGPALPLGSVRPVPAPGLLSDPALAARVGVKRLRAWLAGPAYTGERGVEAPLVAARPSAAGRERFLTVVLRPVRWDPRSGLATALQSVDLAVSWDRPVAPAPEAGAAAPPRGSLAPLDAVGPLYAPAPGVAPAPSRLEAPAAAALRVGPGRPWLRLGVTRPGLYVLSPSDLASAGISVAGIDPATFRLFRARPGDLPESVDVDLAPDGLRECAVSVTGEGDGSFDSGDRIYFYATGSTGFGYDLVLGGSINYEESLQSGEESLWLTWGGPPLPGAPARMTTRAAAPLSAVPLLTQVTHRVHVEENRIYQPSFMSPGLRWERWFYVLETQGSLRRFVFPLPGAVPGTAGSLVARAWGEGISLGLSLFDHYLNISWDGSQIATAGWNFSEPQDLVGSGFAVTTRDTVDFLVPQLSDPTDPNRLDQDLLAWFEVSYARGLAALNDSLQFAAPDSVAAGRLQYRITGVGDTSTVWLLDRTDPENPVRLTGGAVTGAGPFTLTVEDSAGPGYRPRYSLVSMSRAVRPPAIALYAPPVVQYMLPDLLDPGNGADYLIVAPPALLAEAQTLASYRASRLQGLPSPRVAIATMDRVAAQFGAGLSGPVAVRNLIQYARRHWSGPPGLGFSPSYVCLFGDATYDPRNYLGIGAPDWVPAYESFYDEDLQIAYLSDDFYGYLDGDRLLDVAVGRIPARTLEEARIVVEGKIPTYEGATALDPWRARALLVADDSWQRQFIDPVGNGHVEEMERKDTRHLPYPIERSKLYLNDYAWADTFHQSKPAAREEFIARVNQGNWLVDYVGHGAEDVLADEQLFRISDAGRLTNASRPSIFAFVSCTVGKFDEPGSEGMGETLLKLSTGGSVASLASTAPVFPSASTALNDAVVDALFPLAPRADSVATLGFAWARGKNTMPTVGAEGNNTRKYQLLGDPALSPPTPRGRGAWEKAPLDSVLRGEVATLGGRALYSDSTFDSTAVGTAIIQVQGPPFIRTQVSYVSGGPSVVSYQMPGPVLYRGEAPLQNGRFSVTFVTPTDGRLSGRGGRLRALLSSAGGRGVGLAVDSIRIGQGLFPRVDATPPTLSLRYPSPADSAVQAGDRLTIVVEDSSGVDITRLDNAHSIFVVVDELGAPIELTPGFAYDPGSHTRGSVDWLVPGLAQGPHLLEVHASDTYGNIAVRTFVLDVHAPYAAGDPLFLSQVFNYPNPFPRETFVHARLNQPARLRVLILTVAGRRVRELQSEGQAGENYIPWDGKDSRGENVAIGVYLVRVIAETPGGRRATAVGRALRTE